jgi:hypothetical protein
LVAALVALTAAALAAGYQKDQHRWKDQEKLFLTFLASAFLLETFFGFAAVEVFLAVGSSWRKPLGWLSS